MIREIHRRDLGGTHVYNDVPEKDAKGKEVNAQKLRSLQNGEVTRGLKGMIDRLNERPLYKKTIAATDFIRVLEKAFGTTISKTQQDAQEMLQVIAERLSEEYHAGKEARKRHKKQAEIIGDDSKDRDEVVHEQSGYRVETRSSAEVNSQEPEDEDGFPLEGQTQARVECEYCHFVPKAKPTNFVMLNLMVPQKSSATLNDCFDVHFKTEHIEDYKCDKCRLMHAAEILHKGLLDAKTEEQKTAILADIAKLETAVADDPEKPPEGVALPDSKLAPKRKIARHIELKIFPKVLVIHLSRSIYDPRSTSTKNLAKVEFPERLPLGSILNRRKYKLLGVVTHKGTHNSGHYETFRRQHSYAPYSNPHADRASSPYVAAPTSAPSTGIARTARPTSKTSEKHVSGVTFGVSEDSPPTSSPRTSGSHSTQPSSAPDDLDDEAIKVAPGSPNPVAYSQTPERSAFKPKHRSNPSTATAQSKASSMTDISRLRRKKKPLDRWWRISDDKIKECKTAEVLAMTKEVYMLFYEIERDADDNG